MKTVVSTLVFLLKNDQILLAMKKRGFGSGRWNGVGGKQEPGETLDQTMVRETQEEIGVTPLSWRQVAVHNFIMPFRLTDTGDKLVAADGEESSWRMQVHTYLCDSWTGDPVETDEMAPRWLAVRDIPYAQMWSDDIVWLPLVLGGKLLQTTFWFTRQEQITRAELDIVDRLEQV